MAMDFIKEFKSSLKKMDIDEGSSEPPRYWFSSGNYVVNKTLSGSYVNYVPQGRVTALVGPSGAGKSFVLCNVLREAQKQGAYLVVLDSENALDDDFVSKIGVDVNTDYTYISVDTIPQVTKVISAFLKGYKAEHGDNEDAPKVLIAIDSLDMLMTETEEEHFEKGITKGDQGQRSKQQKAMLRTFVQAIKHYNISMLVTAQVYKNQDLTNGEGVYIVSDAIKFSLSQISMLTKLKLRAEEVDHTGFKPVDGIRMKVEGYKTRFTKPFQTVTVEVPYETGMDPFNGLFDVAKAVGVIIPEGKRWKVEGSEDLWYKADFNNVAGDVLVKLEAARDKFLDAKIDDEDIEVETEETSKKRREKKAKEKK
jgi:recombination protein RecA